MKIKILLVGLFIVASTTSAFAAGPYVGTTIGVSVLHDSDVKNPGTPKITASYDLGFGMNVSGGYNFDGARIEGEFGYKSTEIDKLSGPGQGGYVQGADISIMSYMVNGYYDVRTPSQVTPYIGVGLGLVNVKMDINGMKNDDTVFAYQLITGLGIAIKKNIILDLSYRFQGASGDANISGADVQYMSSNFNVGIRYNF
ncbi:MAG: outer membrane beta-barrel protein [Desulfuromonadales bacterium]